MTRDAPAALPATGVVGPGTLGPESSAATQGAAGPSATAPAFTADALALVAFTRSTVETTSKEGVGVLNVASAGMKRPPLGSLMAPLETLVPTSPYGERINPLTGSAGEFHWGQDFAAACGTRVYAADAGVVRAVGWHPWGGGNRVEIDHGNGLITTYNHLEAIAVKKGESVRVGEVIARVGTTGSSTGCHLHFETILNGSHTDPMHWAMIPIKQVDPLGPIAMTSYAPDADKASNATLGWAIPVRTDLAHVVAGGGQERTVAATVAPPSTPSAAAVEAASSSPSPSSPSPSQPSPSQPSPSQPASPSPSQPASPPPTPTSTPTSGPTSTPTSTPTPTPGTPSEPPPAATTPAATTPPLPPAPELPPPAVPAPAPEPPQVPSGPPASVPAPATTAAAVPPPAPEPPAPPAPPATPSDPPAPQPLATNATEPTATLDPTTAPTTAPLP